MVLWLGEKNVAGIIFYKEGSGLTVIEKGFCWGSAGGLPHTAGIRGDGGG